LLTFQFDHYYRYDELALFLQTAVQEYPHLARLESIGMSYEGRNIWLLELSNHGVGEAAQKPAMYIEGNMHAGEVTGCAVCQYTIWYLLSNYGTDPEVTELLNTRTFYINPRVSPDGAERYLTTPYMLRSSVRPYPKEEEAGLRQEDVDGDGYILQMRVKDPMGDWRISDRDDRLLVRRQPGEQHGQFYRVYREGRLRGHQSGGEIQVARPLWGLDFNRNYPANWAPEHQQRGAGPYPLSEPETKAVVDFMLAHQNVQGIMSFHTSGGVILRPYSTKDDQNFPNGDFRNYSVLGRIAKDITGYDLIGVFDGLNGGLPSHGDLKDWAYEHYGVLVFTTELWDIGAAAGATKRDFGREMSDAEREDRELKMLEWQDREFAGQGFVDWHPFEHPELGEVEIGGWKTKEFIQNPPESYLKAECHKNAMFTLKHALLSPLVRVQKVDTVRRDDDLWQLTVTVANEGFLPTNVTEQAVRAKLAKPVEISLETAPAVSLIDGAALVELGHLPGWSKAQVGWVVQGQPGDVCTVRVHAQKGGCDVQVITLG
jgi:murein tripeptide amidase MpaA